MTVAIPFAHQQLALARDCVFAATDTLKNGSNIWQGLITVFYIYFVF
jgi:hypothetical protein